MVKNEPSDWGGLGVGFLLRWRFMSGDFIYGRTWLFALP